MNSEMGFTNAMVSLRAPRVTVAIPNDQRWAYYARRALEALNRTWGGARGTVLPLTEDGAHPAIFRLIQKYDPDHLVPLLASLSDLETTNPGEVPFEVDGMEVRANQRRAFIERAEADGPHLQSTVPSTWVDASRARLNTFMEDEGYPRLHSVHPLQTPDRLIDRKADPAVGAVGIETGDPLLDLSVGIHRGMTTDPTSVKRMEDSDLRHIDIASMLVPNERPRQTMLSAIGLPTPDEATVAGLNAITSGFGRDRGLLVVLGRTADDFALALAWSHFAGSAAWLPFTRSHGKWLSYVGTAVDGARPRGDRPFRVTSASLSAERSDELMSAMWAKRWAHDPNGPAKPWTYIDPLVLEPEGRTDLRLTERWDQRIPLPTTSDNRGGRRMVTRFPLSTPPDGSASRSWLVDVIADRNPILSFPGFPSELLLADEQDRWETFVRPSGVGMSFESGRFDLVLAGASTYGQLAQPQLRWPSLFELLRAAAMRTGNGLRTSAAGHQGRLALALFGGRDDLLDNLQMPSRDLLDQFLPRPKGNGPLADGGIGLRGSNFFTFAELAKRVPTMEDGEIRAWLDERVRGGSMRVGHVLDCETCEWLDFYVLADVSATFECKRCGTRNVLTLDRWRQPIDGAKWYYDLHPSVATFVREHGDVPLLAVDALTRHGMRPERVEFEFEITDASDGKAMAEIDFAFIGQGRLIIGEAKSATDLDGNTKAKRIRDARKLITAGELLGASEVCYATSKTWKQATRDAIHAAVNESATRLTISIAENVARASAATRTVVANAAGP